MASGSFSTSKTAMVSTSVPNHMVCSWSSTNDTSDNMSTIDWVLKAGDADSTDWVTFSNVSLSIDGVLVYQDSSLGEHVYRRNETIATGSITIKHNSDGRRSVSVYAAAGIYAWDVNCTYSGSITMTNNPVYTLSISEGDGSSITVNRTSCGGVCPSGYLSSGTNTLCYGDLLKITFSANANHKIIQQIVNNSSFVSGNTYTVTGNVSIVSVAQPLSSDVGASDANIGSVSTITVTKYSTAYYHSLQYLFGNLSGYITKSGGISTSEQRFCETTIPFVVPATFYSQIPNNQSGRCTIICRTYDSSDSTAILGSETTCYFNARTSSTMCSPDVLAYVEDTNDITTSLTGDNSVLIRYMSTALCTMSATPKNSATISSMKINESFVDGTTTNQIATATKSYGSISADSFSFSATDSRGYTTNTTVNPTIISYIRLTLNPILSRPSPTTGEVSLSFNGNYYRGSFGAHSNTLSIRYRYRTSFESVWSDWIPIDSSNYIIGTTSYHTSSPITLTDISGSTTSFDYLQSYIFQLEAYDGANDVKLTTVVADITVQRGIPVFDWGENDFNFNVPASAPTPTSAEHLINLGYAKSQFAPAGYGLGNSSTQIISSLAKLDGITKNGWYLFSCTGSNIGGYWFNKAVVRVSNIAETDSVFQELQASGSSTILRRVRLDNGVWQEWEFVNPPMEVGVEYRTTKRYNGRAVFCKLVDVGSLPNATYAYISTGVPVWEYPFFTHVEPRLRRDNIGTFDYLDDSMYICTLFRNSATWHFKVSTTSDKSAYSLRIYIEYIKTYDTSYS